MPQQGVLMLFMCKLTVMSFAAVSFSIKNIREFLVPNNYSKSYSNNYSNNYSEVLKYLKYTIKSFLYLRLISPL